MPHANYTVSVITSTETAGDSVAGGTLNATETLVITPNAGYNVSASSFSIGSPLPPEVLNVTFSDTATANTPGNLVNVNVTYQTGFVMPSSNTEILIDIDGEAIIQTSSGSPIAMCLVDNVPHEGFCNNAWWPKSINGTSVLSVSTTTPTPLTAQCQGHFEDASFPDSSFSQSTSTANTNWVDPLFTVGVYSTLYPSGNPIGTSYATQHTANVTPGTTVTVFEKTFWTPPTSAFNPIASPFYVLNQAAINSGYYTVEETPDHYNVDRVVHTATTDGYKIKCDTTDVYPGMQVWGPTFASASFLCFPYWNQDVRVAAVDRTNNEVTLSEYYIGTLSVGDTVNFTSLYEYTYTNPNTGQVWGPVDDYCLSKTFTVKYTAPLTSTQPEPCSEGHVIDFGMHAGVDNIEWEGNDPGAQPMITSVNIDTSNLPADGQERKIVINSEGVANFNVFIQRSDNTYYDFSNNSFSLGGKSLVNQNSYPGTPFSRNISFPACDADYTYTVNVVPLGGDNSLVDKSTILSTGVASQYHIAQYVNKTITFASDATTAGLVLSSFTSPATIVMPGAYDFGVKGRSVATWTGTITKSGSPVIYDTGAGEAATRTSDGSFTNATANGAEMELDVAISGSGTSTITATVVGNVFKQPTSDTTVTLDFDGFLQVKPTVPDVGTRANTERDAEGYVLEDVRSLSLEDGIITVVAGESVAIDLRSYDNDANKASKTLATVVGPTDDGGTTKGSLGSHSGGSVTYTADTNVTKYDVGKIITFTYKGTVSAVDSDPATVYIMIT